MRPGSVCRHLKIAGRVIISRLFHVTSRQPRKLQHILVNYKSQMLPFMPGRRTVDKERAFFAIFSTMIEAVEIARMLPDPAMRGKVLTSARDFSLAQLLTSSTMMPEECLWHILRIAGSHAQFGSTPDCRL